MKQQQGLKYFDYDVQNATPPASDVAATVPPQFLQAPPRTSLATAKRLEVERAKNPEIPFKLSHMGNTLYTPAMMDPPTFRASDILEIVPVHPKGGGAGNMESGRIVSSRGSGRDCAGRLLNSPGATAPRRARRFGQYQPEDLSENRPTEKREQLRPTTSQESMRPVRRQAVLTFDASRPSTATASGMRTSIDIAKSSRASLPKHFAIISTPRQEDRRELERTLKQRDQAQVVAAQPQNRPEVIPTGVSRRASIP